MTPLRSTPADSRVLVQLALACWLIGLIGCQSTESPPPIKPTISTPTATTDPLVGSLRVERVHVPGIPDQDITIDHVNNQITIQLPGSLTDRRPVPVVTLGCTNCAVEANDFQTPQQFRLFFCQSFGAAMDKLTVVATGDPSQRVTYKLTIKSAGQMTLGAVPTYTIDNQCTFPLVIRNFADGYGAKVEYTNRKTGEKGALAGFIDCCQYTANGVVCEAADPDQVWVSFCDAQPGEYDFEIIKENGRRIKSTQPLVVKKGIPLAGWSPWSPAQAGATHVELSGLNLFPDDTFEWLIDTPNKTYHLPLTDLKADGRYAQIDLPTGLAPGYYYAYLVRNGEKAASPYRIAILREKGQPAIISLEQVDLSVPNINPARLLRNRTYTMNYAFPVKGDNSVNLVRVNEEVKVKLPLTVQESFLLYGTGTAPQFTLPATLPPGLYRLSVQRTYQDGQTAESEPLERLIEVQ